MLCFSMQSINYKLEIPDKNGWSQLWILLVIVAHLFMLNAQHNYLHVAQIPHKKILNRNQKIRHTKSKLPFSWQQELKQLSSWLGDDIFVLYFSIWYLTCLRYQNTVQFPVCGWVERRITKNLKTLYRPCLLKNRTENLTDESG